MFILRVQLYLFCLFFLRSSQQKEVSCLLQGHDTCGPLCQLPWGPNPIWLPLMFPTDSAAYNNIYFYHTNLLCSVFTNSFLCVNLVLDYEDGIGGLLLGNRAWLESQFTKGMTWRVYLLSWLLSSLFLSLFPVHNDPLCGVLHWSQQNMNWTVRHNSPLLSLSCRCQVFCPSNKGSN